MFSKYSNKSSKFMFYKKKQKFKKENTDQFILLLEILFWVRRVNGLLISFETDKYDSSYKL